MTTIEAVLKTTLANDATLAAILTGGVMDASDMPFDGGGTDTVPRQTDGVTAKPFAIIRWKDSTSTGAIKRIQGELGTVEIYFYQDTGFDQIELAVARVKALLNLRELSASNRQLAYFEYGFTSGEVDGQALSEELGNIACKFSRYFVTQIR